MNTESLYKAFRLLESDEISDHLYFVGERDESLVCKAEQALGLKFPEDYRQFLLSLGAGSIGSYEIYGITDDDFESSKIPNGVWYTINNRRNGLPKDLILIGHSEVGSPCIRVLQDSEKSPIIAYYLGMPEEAQTYELLGNSFGDYFLENVQQEINYLS